MFFPNSFKWNSPSPQASVHMHDAEINIRATQQMYPMQAVALLPFAALVFGLSEQDGLNTVL